MTKEHTSIRNNLLGKEVDSVIFSSKADDYINNLKYIQQIPFTSEFWESICSITFHKNNEFLLSPHELEELLKENPENFQTLIMKVVHIAIHCDF